VDDDIEPYPAPAVLFFGERWDAPQLDYNTVQVDAPVGRACLHCGEPVEAGDRGLMRLTMRGTRENPVATQEPAHMECDLRMGLGSLAHMEGRCRCCTGIDSEPSSWTAREEALAVLAHVNQLRAAGGRAPM
jgi:hypothetical protein